MAIDDHKDLLDIKYKYSPLFPLTLTAGRDTMYGEEPTTYTVKYNPNGSSIKDLIEVTGTKFDQDKVRYDLLPSEFLEATAVILTFGAKKYGERNWEKGMTWGRPFAAMMRHLWAWWGGKGPSSKNFLFGDTDSETGRSHLWHAACCLAFLITYEERNIGTDDRTKV